MTPPEHHHPSEHDLIDLEIEDLLRVPTSGNALDWTLKDAELAWESVTVRVTPEEPVSSAAYWTLPGKTGQRHLAFRTHARHTTDEHTPPAFAELAVWTSTGWQHLAALTAEDLEGCVTLNDTHLAALHVAAKLQVPSR